MWVSCTLTQVPADYSGHRQSVPLDLAPTLPISVFENRYQYQGGGGRRRGREYAPRSRGDQALVPSRPSRVRGGEAGPSFFPAGRLTPAGVSVENPFLAAVHWQLNPAAKRNS